MESNNRQQQQSNSMAAAKLASEDTHRKRENTDDSESNLSFNSNNDDEPILTATITFDVTVDPSGQVISTSEGQIISESFQNPHDGRSISLSSHHRQFDALSENQVAASNIQMIEEKVTREAIQADSLTSMNSGSNRKDITLHDSLDEVETDEDTSSTSTESLIERSKKYMNQEAGIIILKRDNLTSQNFNINLDFDLKNENNATDGSILTTASQDNDPGKSFNINLDFDIHSNRDGMSGDESSIVAADGSKGFNINLDFDIKDGNVLVPRRSLQDVKKTGVGIDLMITSNATGENNKIEDKIINEINQDVSNIGNSNMVTDQYDDTYLSSTVTYHYIEEPYDDSLNKENNSTNNLNEASRLFTNEGADLIESNLITATESKDININSLDLINQYERLMERNQNRSTLQEDSARIDVIDRMVQKSMKKESAAEKDKFYAKNIPKVSKFSLDDCIDQLLEDGGANTSKKEATASLQAASSLPVLRSFETVDFEALTKGFDSEEVKEGKLVLYITEAQLLQLLKQRAIIIPDKSKLFSSRDSARDTSRTSRVSLLDEKIQDKLGRESPVNAVELVVDRDIQQMCEDPIQDCDNTKPESPEPADSNHRLAHQMHPVHQVNQAYPTHSTLQSRSTHLTIPVHATHPEHSAHLQPADTSCSDMYSPCPTPLSTDERKREEFSIRCESTQNYNDLCPTPTPQPPPLPPPKQSVSIPVQITTTNTQSNLPPTQSLTTQSLGEDCKRLLTFDQSERALSIIREYIDRASKDEENGENVPRRSSLRSTDEPQKTPRVFNAFLNKIFDDQLKNRLIRDSAFEKGLDLLTELVDHIVDEAKVDQHRDSYVEKGKVFENFTDYVHKNIPTYAEKTKQIARDEQINQVMRELSEFYNSAVDCNGKRRSTIESHAEKVLKILGDFVDKELDEDFNGRLFTDEQSDMALTIIKDHLLETIDECYHKNPAPSLKTYDRIDTYIDNLLQTRYSEIDNQSNIVNDAKNSQSSVRSFDRIDNVIDTILQNRLSNMSEKSFDRQADTSNYNILQSRVSISSEKSEIEKQRQESFNQNLSQSRLSSATQKSVDQKEAERKAKNYERIDNAVDAVLQSRLSMASSTNTNNTEQEKKSCKSFDFSNDHTNLTEKKEGKRCKGGSNNRLFNDSQSDKALSLVKEYVLNALNECGRIKLDDSSQNSSFYERKASFAASEKDSESMSSMGCDTKSRRMTSEQQTSRIFDSFLNFIFDDNLKNKLKRNNSYQKGLNLLNEFVDYITERNRRLTPSYNDYFLEKGKLFENFTNYVSKNIPEFKADSNKSFSAYPGCVDEKIKTALQTMSDHYDDAIELNGIKSPENESQEEKIQKILGDFVERISNHFFNNPYAGVEERSAQLPNIVGYREKLSNQTDLAPKIFDTFLNKIFDDNVKNRLMADNSFDKGLSILTDLTDYVTNSVKSINPSYDTFLENGKLFERFSEYVHTNISSDIQLDGPIPKTPSIAACTEQRLKRVIEALSNFYDNALDCNGKRRPTVESNAEKIQKILGDFVDRISNHYYNEPLVSIRERETDQVESRPVSGASRISRAVEPSIDTLKKIDDFIDHVLEKRKYRVEKGNEIQPVQAVSAASIRATSAKIPEKVAVSVIHQNISAKKTPETCYIQDVEKNYRSLEDHISKPLTIDAYQPSINKIATAYDGVKLISPTVAQLNDGKLLRYKDFDLMVPSDYHYRDSSSSDSKSHLDYIVAGSDGSDGFKSIFEKTQVNFPKSYEFLNQGLSYVDKTEEDALSELDKFFQQLVSNLDKDTQRINWPVINKFYSTKDQREKADIIKKFINGLATEVKPEMVSGIIFEDRNKTLPDKTGQTLKILDNFVDHVLEKKPITHKITDREAINLISDLINRLRDFLKNWKPIKNQDLKKILQGNLDNKIIIKTTKKLPAKISVSGNNNKQQQFVRKKITYSYLDNYNPTTRVYELSDTDQLDLKGENVIDLFSSNKDLSYLLKPFDPAIAESMGKPSLEQINKYLTVINTGVKNTDLIQIHPLLNTQTNIKNQSRPSSSTENHPKQTEPVIIDSANYQKYIDDVSKHFSGLQITDFPLYVQGLEFKQNENFENEKLPQTYIKTTKEGTNAPPKTSDGITIPEPTNFYTKQVANNSGNIQYVRVKSSNQIIVAQ